MPLKWNNISNPANPEPNDAAGTEECVRMRHGMFNDAMCYLSHTGSRHAQVGMGFICEKHTVNDPAIFTTIYCDIVERTRTSHAFSAKNCARMTKLINRTFRNTEKGKMHSCAKPHSYVEWSAVVSDLNQAKTVGDFVSVLTKFVNNRVGKCAWSEMIQSKIRRTRGQIGRRLYRKA